MSHWPPETEGLHYVILDADDAPAIVFSEVLETSAATLRWNLVDGEETKTFVKYVGAKPDFLDGKPTMTNSEIRTELLKDEWNPPRPEE